VFLTQPGRNLPKILQPREPQPSTINEKTLGDFARVVNATGILKPVAPEPDRGDG
jgi:hypothetical protein